jgi:hypothetical protein
MTRVFGWAVAVSAGVTAGLLASLAYGAVVTPATIGARDAVSVCDQFSSAAAEYGEITSIARAEASTVSDVIAWQEHRHEPEIAGIRSPLRDKSSGDATICMYRGSFVTPTAPLPDGGRAEAHNVLRLIIVDGEVIFDSAGYEGRMQPETPSLAD